MTPLSHPLLSGGPFAYANARDSGLSRHDLAVLVRDHVLRRMLRGVYVSTELEDSVELRVAALRLVIGAHVVVCGRTAAWLHGIDAFAYAELEVLPAVETCVQPDRGRLRRRGCVGGRRELDAGDVMAVGQVQVTTPLRTAVDLGMRLSRRSGLAMFDAFLHCGFFNRTALQNELCRFRGHRGVIQLRQLVAMADGRSESPGESWIRLEMLDDGLPTPELQLVVGGRAEPIFRLDLAYAKHRVCIEYDGIEFHDSKEQQAHDDARREWLRRHGWIIILVRKEDLTCDSLPSKIAEIRTALQSRHRRSASWRGCGVPDLAARHT